MERVIELPTKEQRLKSPYVATEGKVRKKYATVLEEYYGKGYISLDQFNAGERLHADAYHGGVLSQLKAIDYTRAKEAAASVKALHEISEFKADKHHNFSNAMYNPEIGRVQREILYHICIFDMDASSFGQRHFAMGLLRETLNELIRYYRNLR